MVSRKYVRDYRIDEQYNPLNGKMKSVPVYVGPLFDFTDYQAAASSRKLYSLLTVVITVCYAVLMFVNAPSAHIWYCMIPVVVMMIEIFFLYAGMLRLYTVKPEGVIREHRDKITNRFRQVSLFLMILSGIALLGQIVFLFRVGDEIRDIVFWIAELGILCSSILMFRRLPSIELHEIRGEQEFDPYTGIQEKESESESVSEKTETH